MSMLFQEFDDVALADGEESSESGLPAVRAKKVFFCC